MWHEYEGQPFEVRCDYPPYVEGDRLSPAGVAYVESVLGNLRAAKELAAREFLSTYNEVWIDETQGELTAEQFQAKLVQPSVSILDEPNCCSVYFGDSNMFGGHSIEVDFEGDVPQFAQLVG